MAVASKTLSRELARMMSDPVPGFTVEPASDDIFMWMVGMFGPPGTIYEGAYFKARMKFPETYPMDPPDMTMCQSMWHPNIYEDGRLCISILHPPGDDAMSGELAAERWSPAQSVTTVLLSVISMLNEPNVSSPANVDASVMYRNNREQYDRIVKEQVEESKKVAAREGVIVPVTVDDYQPKRVEEVCAMGGYETSDDEKYIVELDSDSEVESDAEEQEDSDEGSQAEEGEGALESRRSCGRKRTAEDSEDSDMPAAEAEGDTVMS